MSELIEILAGLIDRGGVVMIPLLGMSVIALTLILERTWFWWHTNKPSRVARIMRQTQILAGGDQRARRALAGDESSYGRVVKTVASSEPTDSLAIAAVEAERPRLERFMVTLSTIITAAPLLGILGTVLGIIQSFDLLGQEQSLTDPRVVSAGIAEALLTTALGLVVALFTLFPYMVFKGQVDRTLGRLEAVVAAIREAAASTDPGAETEQVQAPTTKQETPAPMAAR